jgi:DNA-binding transcriptional MocR family regulator
MKRRAAYIAQRDGLRTQKDLSTRMRVSTTTARDLYHYLQNEGFVVRATGSKNSGYAATGKPYYVAPGDGPAHQKMLSELFDPQMHISHYVSLQ